MQGLLAQAQNGAELFWEEKLHAVTVKAQACTQGALFFFILSLGAGKDFFSFFLGSQCVLTMFPLSSHMFPNMFSIPPHFYGIYALANLLLLSLYR